MNTIIDIINRLDQIIEECKVQKNRVGYFAVLYRQVTIRIKNGIDRKEFEDNPRMEKLDGELVDDTKQQISRFSPLFKLLVPLAKGKDEILANFSIKVARKGAWKFANEYARSSNRSHNLHQRDLVIAGLAQGMIAPGRRIIFIMRLIALTEWKAVPSIIEDLEHIGAS